jgi:acylpyruvate hydrolase
MKIICVGRNYAAHAAELNNPVPVTPLIFMKPATALLKGNKPFFYPEFTQDLHHEIELVVRICKPGKHIKPQFAQKYYEEITVGIDFTARDIQQKCKENGHPWELAKAWDNSAILGTFISLEEAKQADGSIHFSMTKNGETVQAGVSSDMLNDIDAIICYVSKYFGLKKGDLIFTGTPKGVGPVQPGDVLEGFIDQQALLQCKVK